MRRKPIDKLPDLDPDGLVALAAGVLKKSVDDGDYGCPYLKFWCDVVNLNYSVFIAKAKEA